MRFLFVHGWGFDASFWKPLLSMPDLDDSRATVFEAGYFGAPPHLALPEEPFVAITHSAGTPWFLERMPPWCRKLLVINGFARFSCADDFRSGIPLRILTRMRQRLGNEPETTLGDFRARVGCRESWEGAPDIARLEAGLQRLCEVDARQPARENAERIAWIAGARDPLISSYMTHESFSPVSSGLIYEGGHLLPLEEPNRLATWIRDMAL
ncbi:alpha/beta fold hydrolase [Brytella acorum]|uniref:Biotin synthase n=1 Tax=Brytella acorum TaxID=2959299 RepID=A0AA35Y162_9PROT|nr:biotin synthase [Brytella acorum]MDF3625443.1 biotin synthase [Brytella acorum]CAI9120294.1 biotin synthase [Brytella acorum]